MLRENAKIKDVKLFGVLKKNLLRLLVLYQ
jgi:hypothetical protein